VLEVTHQLNQSPQLQTLTGWHTTTPVTFSKTDNDHRQTPVNGTEEAESHISEDRSGAYGKGYGDIEVEETGRE